MAEKITTLSDWINASPANRRAFYQEGLILEASEAIYEALQHNDLNPVDLARALGKSESDISQLLNGKRNMTLRTLADIALAIGMEVEVRLVPIKL